MATFEISPLFRSASIGIDRTWDPLHTAVHLDGTGFPACNILQLAEDEYRITLAVPGFTEAELHIETCDRVVWVKGSREVDPHHNQYLYRGIANQSFQRTFHLPEHVRVDKARLESGLLHLDLVREVPEELRPRQIEIQQDPQPRRVLQDASKAA